MFVRKQLKTIFQKKSEKIAIKVLALDGYFFAFSLSILTFLAHILK